LGVLRLGLGSESRTHAFREQRQANPLAKSEVCGNGTLRTVDFGDQQPESREVQTFTCGHEVEGGRLRTADADRLDVERRKSEETVTPIDTEQ
jgi:hypothetical protein